MGVSLLDKMGWQALPFAMTLLAIPLFIIFLLVKKWLRKDIQGRRQMEYLQKELDQLNE